MNQDIVSRHNQLNFEIRQLVKMKREAQIATEAKQAEVTALDVNLNALAKRRDMLLAEVAKAEQRHKEVFIDAGTSQIKVTYSSRMPKWVAKWLTKHLIYAAITNGDKFVEWSKQVDKTTGTPQENTANANIELPEPVPTQTTQVNI